MRASRNLVLSILPILACLSGFTQEARAASATLTINSQTGDFVGQGQDWDINYTPQNSDNFFAFVGQTLPSGAPDAISFIMGTVASGSSNTFATLAFETTELGVPLAVGTFDDAQRAGFEASGHPGLEVTFQNRGLNTLVGSFQITQISFYTDGQGHLQIGSFAASFTEAAGTSSPGLTGTFTYQGDVSVPEPAGLVLLGLGAIAMAGPIGARRLGRSRRHRVGAA